jgi:DUF1009 family protein
MSASEKINFEKIGIIAGGGDVPRAVASACKANVFVIGFVGQSDPDFIEAYDHIWVKIGQTGAVLKALAQRGIADVVLIGHMQRPSWNEIKPDLKTVEFLARAGMKMLGDDALLRLLRDFLENEGLRVHGAHVIAPDLLMPAGVIGKVKPAKEALADIAYGFEIGQAVGALDIGQSVVVQQGIVLGVEAAEGTDRLIGRCGGLKRKGSAPVLVKSCKPQQDEDMDLPTAGPMTIRAAQEAGFAGIALQAGKSLLLDREAVVRYANEHKMFVVGI